MDRRDDTAGPGAAPGQHDHPGPGPPRRLGWALQLLIGGFGFGLAYAPLLAASDPSPQSLPWAGGLLGLAHGVLVGLALGPLGALRPGEGPRTSRPGEVTRRPGPSGRNCGPLTPVSLVAAHLLYAAVVVALYSWLTEGPCGESSSHRNGTERFSGMAPGQPV